MATGGEGITPNGLDHDLNELHLGDDARDASDSRDTIAASLTLVVPSSVLIITNIFDAVFNSSEIKAEFEENFRKIDIDAQFQYLTCFHRARITFSSIDGATNAHRKLHNREFHGQSIKCYYAQLLVDNMETTSKYLELPEPDKLFLISPPSSPPVGWEVINERKPEINYDLIAAIAKMGPSDSYEVHHGDENQPSIVVHICEDPIAYNTRPQKIVQTRCPARKP